MSANDIGYNSGIPLPRIGRLVSTARPLGIVVEWANGFRTGIETIDLSPIIYSYRIFRPLRNNQALFQTARLINDGDAVAWDGPDLELSAEAIEALAEQTMTPRDFVAFLERNNLSQKAVAAFFGYSRRQIGYYTTTGPIPRIVALACLGYEAALRNFNVPPLPTASTTTAKVHDTTEEPLPNPKVGGDKVSA